MAGDNVQQGWQKGSCGNLLIANKLLPLAICLLHCMLTAFSMCLVYLQNIIILLQHVFS